MSSDIAALAEIDENLVRRTLSALEQAEALAKRKEIYDRLYPETDRPHGGRRKNDENISPFSEDAAKKLGVSQRTIQSELKIAQMSDIQGLAGLQART